MDGAVVNLDRCARAETDRVFAAFQDQADVVSAWLHHRTPIADQDGSITVGFSGCGVGRPTRSPITDGSSYTVRRYWLRAEILRGARTFPVIAGGWPPPQRSAA